jgi:DNA-binding SARP family transcriptional activator
MTYLANWELHRKRYADARTLYEKIIVANPYWDEAHIGVIECLMKEGLFTAARTHFLNYKQVLTEELGAQPSPSLRQLFERIDNP